MMTVNELKAYVLGEIETAKAQNRSGDYIRGQIVGLFKMYREVAQAHGTFDMEAHMDALLDVLEEI